jgi:hypothetical protein
MKGLEPPRPKAQDPKSCAATNYATPACRISQKMECKVTLFLDTLFQRCQSGFIIWLLNDVGNLLTVKNDAVFIYDNHCT